jgi:hypothetical protein
VLPGAVAPLEEAATMRTKAITPPIEGRRVSGVVVMEETELCCLI